MTGKFTELAVDDPKGYLSSKYSEKGGFDYLAILVKRISARRSDLKIEIAYSLQKNLCVIDFVDMEHWLYLVDSGNFKEAKNFNFVVPCRPIHFESSFHHQYKAMRQCLKRAVGKDKIDSLIKKAKSKLLVDEANSAFNTLVAIDDALAFVVRHIRSFEIKTRLVA